MIRTDKEEEQELLSDILGCKRAEKIIGVIEAGEKPWPLDRIALETHIWGNQECGIKACQSCQDKYNQAISKTVSKD